LDIGFIFDHVRMYAPSCSPCPPAQNLKLTSFFAGYSMRAKVVHIRLARLLEKLNLRFSVYNKTH